MKFVRNDVPTRGNEPVLIHTSLFGLLSIVIRSLPFNTNLLSTSRHITFDISYALGQILILIDVLLCHISLPILEL